MVRFRLRSQHTGQVQEFTLLDILNIIGDTINDEIRFNDGNLEEVYNLSSFQDTGGEGGVVTETKNNTQLVNEAIAFVNGQHTVTIGSHPVSICMIFLNGIKLRQGIDYNKNGRTIELLFGLTVSPTHTDLLEALYDVIPQ